MTTIVYLHGFGSNNQTEKVGFLREAFPEAFVAAPNIPPTAHEAYKTINQFITDLFVTDNNVILVGTSLGGFWAHYFGFEFNVPVVLMNPSLNPSTTLKRYADGKPTRVEGFTSEQADEYAYYEERLYFVPMNERVVLLEDGDEILDSFATYNKYKGNSEAILIPGGSHRFEHLDVLKEQVKGIIENEVF